VLLQAVGVIAAHLKVVRQGSLGRAPDFPQVDVDWRTAPPPARATGNHDRIDLSALGGVGNGADGIIRGEQAEPP
jgi:hypothetical protein